jgi:SMODS and SLOG-associating 2TM effector domain 1
VSAREEQFAEIYRQARVADQGAYYEARAEAFEHAHRQLLLVSAVVFGLAAATGLIAGLDVPGKVVFAVVAAVLPSISTALSAYEGLYAFQRVAKLYRDAARNLRRVDPPAAFEATAVAEYVRDVEHVFTSERGQWGQLAVETASERQKG